MAQSRFTATPVPEVLWTIPSTINGWPVAIIFPRAFCNCTNLTSVSIPNSVTNIGGNYYPGVVSLGAFQGCTSLTNISVGNSVTYIGENTFAVCTSLASITIPNSVTFIDSSAFEDCTSLTSVCFTGNAPSLRGHTFSGDTATIYYLPWTTGWSTSFGGLTAVPWLPQAQTCDAAFGVQTNQFGFNINWASGQTVVVEASVDLISWQPVGTNTITGGSSYFGDPQ